jgi:outer membrane protein assembly factor BamA
MGLGEFGAAQARRNGTGERAASGRPPLGPSGIRGGAAWPAVARGGGRAAHLLAMAFLLLVVIPALLEGEERRVSPREADGLRVATISFDYPSHKALKTKDLRSAMRIREGERFRNRYFRGDLAAVLAFYQARGYREAEITRKQLWVDQRNRLHLEIELDSGPLWRVGAVLIDGGAPLGESELMGLLRVQPGDDLNYGRVLEDERSLLIYLNRQGYAQARVDNQWQDDPGTHTADVIYQVDPGSRMYFGDITIADEEQLHTRVDLVKRYLTFARGDLYNPQELSQSRQQLSGTELFRSVFFSTPERASGDSLQPVHIRLQERKYISLGANAHVNITPDNMTPRVSASVVHNNWLGRGMKLGTDLSRGQPLQGGTLYMMERDILRSGADLVLSLGLTDEWGATKVSGDPDDRRQFDLLTANDSALGALLDSTGEDSAKAYIQSVVYDYSSIERLLELSGTLTRSWEGIYQTQLRLDFTRARNYPDPHAAIHYAPGERFLDGSNAGSKAGEEGTPGDGDGASDGNGETYVDSSGNGRIAVDNVWSGILTDRSRSVNLSTEFVRDTRDDRIAPTRGTFLRVSGLYAIELGSRSTQVMDGEAEARGYRRLSDNLVLAVAGHYTQIASLRSDRTLPQVYWKRYGGEGSLRGVARDQIVAVGGGRSGLNLRAELRFQAGAFGLVGFLDRAGVWRHAAEIGPADLVRPRGMVDGYGLGARYVVGFPFRLDMAFNDGFDKKHGMRIYFSIGQAF